MKVNLILGIGVMLALAACEKSNNEVVNNKEDQQKEVNCYPLDEGSYWVYNTYEIDSLGNEVAISLNDTVKILGDSTINGLVYSKILRKQYAFSPNKEVFLRRDSAGFIIDENNIIVLTHMPDGSIFQEDHFPSQDDSNISFYYMMEKVEGNYDHYLSSFRDVLKRNLMVKYHNEDGAPVRYLESYYAPEVGQLIRQYSYTTLLLTEEKYYEERLIEYFIPKIIE